MLCGVKGSKGLDLIRRGFVLYRIDSKCSVCKGCDYNSKVQLYVFEEKRARKSSSCGVEFGRRSKKVGVNSFEGDHSNLELETDNWSRRSETIDSNSYRSEEFQEC